MSVISIAELKARFASTDKPSQKDFDDLIDTLLAGSGQSTPTGAAGGDLAGSTYPNPVVAPNAITLAKIQQISTLRLLGRFNPLTGNVEEIQVGAGLLLSGNQLIWTGGGGGGGGSGTVAGAVSTFTSTLIALPAGDGVFEIQAPVEFGATLPQVIRVSAVCSAPFAHYLVGDEVPLEYFRDKTDPETPCFYRSDFIDGGQVTVQIRAEYGDIADVVGAPGTVGIAVYDRDLTTGPGPADATLVPFVTGDGPENYFAIRVYMARFAPGTGLGSIALFEPADQVLPAATEVATFTHSYGTPPSLPVMTSLVCVIADPATGHAVGDMVPIEQSFEAGFVNPAFGVTSNNSDILVRREATTIEIPHKTTGALTTITDSTNWQIRVRTAKGVNLPSIAFPALTYQVANPMCAWSYGDFLYIVHWDNGLDKSFLCRIDMATNGVTLATAGQYSPQSLHGNASMFRLTKLGVPTDCIFMCDNRGIHRIDMDDETETTLFSGDYRHYKVLDVDESGGGGYDRPNILYAQCTYGTANTNGSMSPRLRTWTGAFPAGSYGAASSRGEIDWSTLAGVGGAAYGTYQTLDQQSQAILHFSYNPVKRRIYMIHTGSGYLNIFQLDPGKTLIGWWDSDPDGSELDFEKMLALPGGGDTWTDTTAEHMFVEYDTVTGAEKAFVIVRRGNTSLTGSVCRIPWNE